MAYATVVNAHWFRFASITCAAKFNLCRCFLAGAVPELASGAVGARHHLWVAQVVWHWLLWVMWQAGLLQTDNADDVSLTQSGQLTTP